MLLLFTSIDFLPAFCFIFMEYSFDEFSRVLAAVCQPETSKTTSILCNIREFQTESDEISPSKRQREGKKKKKNNPLFLQKHLSHLRQSFTALAVLEMQLCITRKERCLKANIKYML